MSEHNKSAIDNPWREEIENVIKGDNHFRSGDWYRLLEELDALYADQSTQNRRLEIARYELQRERLKAERLFNVLMGIFNLLNPEAMQLEDGRALRFSNPYANETLDALSKRIRAIKAEVEALSTQPQAPQGAVTGWISIDERLPESGVRVLVMLTDPDDTGWVVTTPWIALYMNGYWHDCDAIMDGCEITHWMPLPAAPETPEGKK